MDDSDVIIGNNFAAKLIRYKEINTLYRINGMLAYNIEKCNRYQGNFYRIAF